MLSCDVVVLADDNWGPVHTRTCESQDRRVGARYAAELTSIGHLVYVIELIRAYRYELARVDKTLIV